MKKSKNEIPVLIPSDIPKIYATGSYGGYSPFDFRLMLFSEQALQEDKIISPKKIDIAREIQAEIILSPLAAKHLAIWLLNQVEKFEKEIGPIPDPNK